MLTISRYHTERENFICALFLSHENCEDFIFVKYMTCKIYMCVCTCAHVHMDAHVYAGMFMG